MCVIATCRKTHSEGHATIFSFNISKIQRNRSGFTSTEKGSQRILLTSQRREMLRHRRHFCTDVRHDIFCTLNYLNLSQVCCEGQLPGWANPMLSSTLSQLCSLWTIAGLCLTRHESREIGWGLPTTLIAVMSACWLTDVCSKKSNPSGFHHLTNIFCLMSFICLLAGPMVAWP